MTAPADKDGRGEISPQERAAFERRVAELDQKLDKVRRGGDAARSEASRYAGDSRGYGQGFRMATDMVAAVAVGGLLGFGLDKLFGTLPLFLFVLLMLGFAAGIRNAVKTANRMQAEAVARSGLGTSVPDTDDDKDD